ncbi:MAG: ribonuclease J [Candidatus Pacebacteria bacterium]|nr:ribonuclease J [Candidatus Paceibacterota bacterium]
MRAWSADSGTTTTKRKPQQKRRRPQQQKRKAPITKKKVDKIPSPGENIRIIPLGGVEEIGRNMTLIEYKDEIIVVDCGIQFTDEDTPGVDYILPNIRYLEENKAKIKAMVITHGHLDHIGSIPYIINKIGNPPIYTREFGALLIQKRQQEHPHLPKLDLKIIEKDASAIKLTEHMKVRFFGLTHSIPDSTGIIIETPFGDIVNTGDVRVENRGGKPADEEFEQYKMFKDRNVLLLSMDSTGIAQPGWTISEDEVIANIDQIVGTTKGRLIIATFASQVERIIEFIKIAKKYGRKIVVEGRSMKTNFEIIKHLDLVEVDHVIPLEDIEKHPPHKVLILATGAQGEEFAALMRMSNKTHKYIRLTSSDTIILSSSVIPGNEKSVTKLKDNLYRHDAHIITYLDSDVHASGHGKRAELEWIHKQIPYKFFMPVHGYHYMLKMHAEMARSLGAAKENIVVPDNGSVVEITPNGESIMIRRERAPHDEMMVEGSNVGDIQDVVIRDRKMLAEDGMFVIIASINTKTGKLKKSPDIISRGFVYLRESQELLQQTRILIKKSVENSTRGMNPINFDYVKERVTKDVTRFLMQKTEKKPIIIPVVLGV